jgi:hypothetical protein
LSAGVLTRMAGDAERHAVAHVVPEFRMLRPRPDVMGVDPDAPLTPALPARPVVPLVHGPSPRAVLGAYLLLLGFGRDAALPVPVPISPDIWTRPTTLLQRYELSSALRPTRALRCAPLRLTAHLAGRTRGAALGRGTLGFEAFRALFAAFREDPRPGPAAFVGWHRHTQSIYAQHFVTARRVA